MAHLIHTVDAFRCVIFRVEVIIEHLYHLVATSNPLERLATRLIKRMRHVVVFLVPPVRGARMGRVLLDRKTAHGGQVLEIVLCLELRV